jgi:hypothetical protein
LHPILAGSHIGVAGKYRIAEFPAQRHITIDAVNQSPADGTAVCDLGHDIAPDGRVGASTIVEHDDIARRNIVDEVTHGADWLGGRAIENGESPSGHAKVRMPRRDAMALADEPELVQRVRDGGRIDPAGTRDGVVDHRASSNMNS